VFAASRLDAWCTWTLTSCRRTRTKQITKTSPSQRMRRPISSGPRADSRHRRRGRGGARQRGRRPGDGRRRGGGGRGRGGRGGAGPRYLAEADAALCQVLLVQVGHVPLGLGQGRFVDVG